MFLITWLVIYLFQIIPIEAARDGDVRLVNSNRYGEGRVEVFYQGSWGTICHRGWDIEDAEVICRQLGFSNGAQRSFSGARFGEGSGRVLLSDVNCVGDENNLLECDNVQSNWAINDCQHGSDVGVQCSAPNFEGCFSIGLLRASEGFQAEDMTLEKCFSVCTPGRHRYLWIQNGESCDCGNEIDRSALVDKEECSIECPGNSDQLCGGVDRASVYKVALDLPYVASPGFPGRYTSTGGAPIARNSVPQETTGYSYIRFHQFELPSTVALLVSTNDRNETIQGGIGVNEYWIFSANSPIQVSFQPPPENTESLGFLLEFGEGTYCPGVTVSNGDISTSALEPYTVGTQINVRCNSGYMAYDDTVFCQADGTYNRNIQCDPSGSAPVPPSATTRQPQGVVTNAPITRPLIPDLTVAGFGCSIPTFDNGHVNATPGREILNTGDVLQVTCNPAYEAVDSTVTCQRNGTLTAIPECRFNTVFLIIVIAIAAFVFILIIVLVVILICCSCYFSRKKRRRVSSYDRRNESTMNELDFRGPSGGPPRLAANDDNDTIFALPGDGGNLNAYSEGTFPRPPTPPESSDSGTIDRGSAERTLTSNRNENGRTGDVSLTGTNDEQDAIRSLDNVVDDMERETLYGKVMRPTVAASGGFGGHFSRT